MSERYDPTVTVCDKCLQAACWQGEFYCDDHMSAGVVDRPVSTLIGPKVSPKLPEGHPNEHPDYWNKDLAMRHERLLTRNDLERLGITNPESLDLSSNIT